eukprot:gene17060-20324_t
MEQLTRNLLGRMQAELQKVASKTDNHLQQAEKSFYVVEAAIRELKDFVTTHEFRNEEEEIRFFKEIKPMFLKELVYYTELLHIESHKPVGILYNYYRADKSDMDSIYFLRRMVISPQQPIYTLDLDAAFCTPHSNALGKILAFEELGNFLEHAIKDTPQPKQSETCSSAKSPWVWNGADVGLYEVGFGLWNSGAVAHGPGGFRQFMIELCAFFSVKAGNPYRIVLGMSYRKKGRTPFLRNLVEVAERLSKHFSGQKFSFLFSEIKRSKVAAPCQNRLPIRCTFASSTTGKGFPENLKLKAKAMLEAITWKQYIGGVAIAALVYYTFIGLIYYRQKIKQLLSGSGNNGPSIYELEELVSEIRHSILEKSGKETTKQELLHQLKARLVNYSGLRKPDFRHALNNNLIMGAEELCGVSFSAGFGEGESPVALSPLPVVTDGQPGKGKIKYRDR